MAGMKVDRDELLRRFYARDSAHDGSFLVGVVTTGIYCLPSCAARKPRPENVRFFEGEGQARSAGLRPCRRCRPDHFYRGFDPDRELLRRLVARIRAAPGDFPDAGALARASLVGATKLNALFRRYHHATPSAFLARARVEHAMRALGREGASPLDAAHASGFESPSAFYANFRASTGMTPGAYRRLGSGAELRLALPADFRRDELLSLSARDPDGRTERVEGARLSKALVLAGEPARLELSFAGTAVRARIACERGVSRETALAAHAALRRMLGFASDPGPFERAMLRAPGLARLVRGRRGLRIPQTCDVFEGLTWVIVGQQVNLAFAAACRARLIALAGRPAGDGSVAHPTPAEVARLDYADLEKLQFSRRKAEYLIDAARRVAAGELALEELGEADVDRAAEELGRLRGLGPWSIQVLLMRSLGFEDCVPVGDSGLGAALRRFFALDERPDERETLARMEPFVPWRSIATFHLWKSLTETDDDVRAP